MLLRALIATLLLAASHLQAKEPLIIALDADLSAVAKEGGIAIQRGAQIAIDEVNAEGGVLGRPLELKNFDHRGNPARGIFNIKKIAATPRVLAVLGGVHTPVALEELPYIHEHKLIYLDPWAAGTPIVDNGYSPNFVFRVSVRDQEAGKVLIKEAHRAGHRKVALLLEKTGWGRSNEKSMRLAAEKQGMEVVSVEWFNWKQVDMAKEYDAIESSGAQAIMLVANAPEGAEAVKENHSRGPTGQLPIYSHWGIAGGSFIDRVGLETVRNSELYVLQTYSFAAPYDKALNQQVLNAYRDKFDANASAESIPGAVGVAHSYDLVKMLAHAANSAQTTDTEKLRQALENIENFKGLLKEYQQPFSETRHDALWAEDYFISVYNKNGHLVPHVSN